MKKQRWKPNNGEHYFYISFEYKDLTGAVAISKAYWNDLSDESYYRYKIGNCFKNVEEAKQKLKELKQVLKADLNKGVKMETIVKIAWDEPQDENWLCPENIQVALSAYCPNTKFRVTKLSLPIENRVNPPKVWIVEGYDSLTNADEIKGVFSTEEKAKKYLYDNNYFGEPTEHEVI